MERARARGKALCGHSSETCGSALMRWADVGGYLDDHECISPDEVVEKARLGIRIVLCEDSGASDVRRACPRSPSTGWTRAASRFARTCCHRSSSCARGTIDRCVRYR